MNLPGIDISNAFESFPALWEEFEQRFQLLLTIHDHIGVFMMPNGRRLLPRHNIHRATCCQYKIGKRLRCFQHCRHNVIVEGKKRRGPFRYQCWRASSNALSRFFKEKEPLRPSSPAPGDPDFPVDTLKILSAALPAHARGGRVGNEVASPDPDGNALMHHNNLPVHIPSRNRPKGKSGSLNNASYHKSPRRPGTHWFVSVTTSHIVNEPPMQLFTPSANRSKSN